jgi:hypothetical protein
MFVGRSVTFHTFCSAFLHMPEPLIRAVWHALWKAKWTRACAVRRAFLVHDSLHHHVDFEGLFRTVSPKNLVQTLEELVQEELLSRHDSHSAQECVLRQTTKSGQWPSVVSSQ